MIYYPMIVTLYICYLNNCNPYFLNKDDYPKGLLKHERLSASIASVKRFEEA